MSFSDCHQKQPASPSALSHQSRSWEKTMIALVYLKRHRAKGREGEILLMLLYFPNESMQNSQRITSQCDSTTRNKDGKFHPGTIKSKPSARAGQIATHTWLTWEEFPKLQGKAAYEAPDCYFHFSCHSVAIPEVLLLLTVISFSLSECLRSRH